MEQDARWPAGRDPDAPEPLPVVLLSGPARAGVEAVAESLRLDVPRSSVLVHGLDAVGAGWVRRDHVDAEGRRRQARVPLAHGCVSCTLREDVVRAVAVTALHGDTDRLIVASPSVVEPGAVAAALDAALVDDAPLVEHARLRALVTVLDAERLLAELMSCDTLADRGTATAVTDDRTVAQVLVAQVEYADVLVLTRTDALDATDRGMVDAVLARLAPVAPRYTFRPGVLPAHRLLTEQLYDRDRTPANAGWARELGGDPLPRACEHGVSTMVFRSRRPFAPARLHEVLADPFDGLLRSRGFCWLSTRPDEVVAWDQAGPGLDLSPCGHWLAEGSPAEWDRLNPQERARVEAVWDPYYGDRATELVLTGLHLDHRAVSSALDACLLTDGELAQGRDGWRAMPDPFWTEADR